MMKTLLLALALIHHVYNCPAGQFDANGVCYPCDVTCKSCTGGSYAACTSCDPTRLINAINACQCLDGYVQSSPPVTKCSVLTCDYSCFTCNVTATTCTSCKTPDHRILVTATSTCNCLPQYYDDGANSACASCHYTCTTCSSNTDTTCLTCDQPTNFRTFTAGTCPCSPKYYDNNVYVCLACNYKCKTCQTSATNCLTCGANRGAAPGCLCSTGYYDDGVSETCPACNYTCLTCTNGTSCTGCDATKHRQPTSTNVLCTCMYHYFDQGVVLCSACDPRCFTCSATSVCLTCNPVSYREYDPTSKFCLCRQSYYQTSATVELCAKCDSRCLTCSTLATNCTSCDQANNRVLTTNACPCKPFFFENSNTLCQGCQASCYTCTNTSACTACVTGSGMTINSSNLCSCPLGTFFNNVTSVCQGCDHSCGSCGISATDCLTCPASSHRTFTSKTCPCDVHYYDDGSNPTCASCHYSCLTCTSTTALTCLTCTSSAYRYFSSSQCLCQVHYYDNGSLQLCQPCMYNCLTCVNPSSCSSCNTTDYRVLDTSVSPTTCRCFDYYFEYNKTCVACTYSCKTCNDFSHCVTCDAATDHRQYNASTLLCDCQIGYYDNFVDRTCLPCLPECLTCTNASACTACDSARHRALTATAFCPCIDMYFDVLGTCTGCLYYCATCSSPSSCSTCNSSALRKLSATAQCICADNYYDDGSHELCLPCSYACLTCVSTSMTCISCDSTLRILNLNWCGCPQHYYDNNVTVACPKCHYSCSTCLMASKCDTCNATLQRTFDVANQYCICNPGYYDDTMNEDCQPCDYRCSTCTNSSKCLTCSVAWFRAVPASVCPCIDGYYDNKSPTCLQCHYSCKTCTNGSQCLTCDLSTSHRKLLNTNYLCGCIDRYFDDLLSHQLCLPCLYSCLTCVSTSTTCTSCNSSAFRVIASTDCPCQQRFYDNNQELCLPCSYSCSKCVNPNQCTECNATRHRIADSTNDKCKCDILYWDNNSTELCQACEPTCLTCTDLSKCLSCNVTRNRLLNSTTDFFQVSSPFCVCNYRHYSPAPAQDCQPCHYSCQVCTGGNRNNCALCTTEARRTLDNATKECKCNDGYYDDTFVEECQTCHAACMICTGGLPSNCTVCSPLYYLLIGWTTCFESCPDFYFDYQVNFTCQPCPSHCQKCVNSTYCSSCQTAPAKYLLYNATCFAACPGGTYPNSDGTVCLDCPKGCYSCSNNSYCSSCYSKFYFNPALDFCFSCNDVCLNCTGPGQTECTACSSPLVLLKGTCSVLSCGLGTYVDPLDGCVQCQKKYPGATLCNSTQALACSSSYIYQSNKCVACASAAGYQVRSDGSCGQICGDGILIYLQCDDGNTYDGDGCSAKCTIERGWNCSGQPSKCQLISPLQLKVLSAYKKSGVNTVVLTMELSLPMRIGVSSFAIAISGLGSDRFSFSISQPISNLSIIAITVDYQDSLQGRALEISYQSTARRRLAQHNQPRVLISVTFSTTFDLTPYPPADYYPGNTLARFTSFRNYINALALALLVLAVVAVPKRMHLHVLSLGYIPGLVYLGFGVTGSKFTDWVQFTLKETRVMSMMGGASFGSCCTTVNEQFGLTSQITRESGVVLLVLVLSWAVLLGLTLFNSHCYKIEQTLKMVNYFSFTLMLLLGFPLIYMSVTAWRHYSLGTPTDAFNTVLAILFNVFYAVILVALWLRTYYLKTELKKDERKIYSAHSNINKPETEDINLEKDRDATEFALENNSRTDLFSNHEEVETKMRATARTAEKEAPSVQHYPNLDPQKIQHNEYEPLYFDYLTLYDHYNAPSAEKGKYYLPLLFTKIYLSALLAPLLTDTPLAYFIILALLELIFVVYLLVVRPFLSTFTHFRLIAVALGLIAGEVIMSMYLYHSSNNDYRFFLEELIVYVLLGILGLSVVFAILQHILAWKHELWRRVFEPCLKGTRLMGTRVAPVLTFEQNHTISEKSLKLSGANFRPGQPSDEQMDAFYARMLKKQTLNKKYKRERMLK